MSFPAPTEKQARVLWFSLTTLAIVLILALAGVLLWGFGWVANRLASVLLPLAVAAILACLLDPLVDYFEARLRIPRTRAILLVFFLAVMLVLIMLATVVPQLVYEIRQLFDNLPATIKGLKDRLQTLLEQTPLGIKVKDAWEKDYGLRFQNWLTGVFPAISEWLLEQVAKVAGWFGFMLGLALVPVYTFYFLLEKKGIQDNWTDYLPLTESKLKEEAVFILRSFNDCLVAFFRGQVLVALCMGTMLTVGYWLIGLNYALLLGVTAALLGIVPYLGSMTSVTLATVLAAVQFQDWWHPALVVAWFVLAQLAEGLYISPKIIGDRVGLHPLTVIIALMVGTTLPSNP
jgi:predicted PurR-regulated permease PerM